jgi:hypothetical protein
MFEGGFVKTLRRGGGGAVSIARPLLQMAALDFPAYNSLYFADLPTDSASKQSFVQGFCIGPHCGTRY